jgi:hypothetical protein
MFFFIYLKKIHHFGGPKHSSSSALPGLDRKKNILNLLTYSYLAKSDKFKNNKEKAIIVFCNFSFQGSIFLKVTKYKHV